MGKTDYAGIDYSLGKANRDAKGISYGIISLHDLGEFAIESFEPVYSKHCYACGEALNEDFDEFGEDNECHGCGAVLDEPEKIYPDEPDEWTFEDNEYSLMLDEHNDVWVFKSPYVTNAQFCSPCAPGAGHLANPCDDGPTTYALGEDWFDEENPMPYVVRRLD